LNVFDNFIESIHVRLRVQISSNNNVFVFSGLAGLEFISHYLTAQGSFIARELMQEDVTYENYTVNLTEEQRRITRMSVIVVIG